MSEDRGATVRVGPAGWSYDDWAGPVYPVPRPRGFDPLSFLARYVDTVEINSTFYRPASVATARSWLARTADQPRFRFTAKLWQRFTHEQEAGAWTAADVRQARAALDTLHAGDRLGAVLLQFPWRFRRTPENREWLGDLVAAFTELPLVVEVRHDSWLVPEFFESLTERKVGFVNIDQPLFKRSVKPSAEATAPVGYVRVHGRNAKDWFRQDAGVNERYDYLYSAEELAPWVERTREIAAETAETYVVTNNHFRGQAMANGVMLRAMLDGEPAATPPQLLDAFRDVLAPYAREA
jgi:uncharacterized protein YecE (DUF72 family)